ncbi:MAG: hypothetical protein RL758_201 [Pseudomonadota bacterium]|jgi:hypothetical protein
MTFTASAGSINATQTQAVTQSSTAIVTPLLINGGSISPSGTFYTASADEILLTCTPTGTLSGDSTAELQVTVASGVVQVLKSWTNAQIVAGFAEIVRVGLGTQFRLQFKAGTTTGANGVTFRFRN